MRALTGLRFAAALYVFVFHVQIHWPLTSNAWIKNIISQGALGMSLFFMLSGFILAHRYGNSPVSLYAYFTNRVARIYPIYLLAALTTLPWLGISIGGDTALHWLGSLAQLTLLVVANLFLIQAWFPQFFDYWNDGGSWSISVEAFCYAVFPFALSRLSKLSTQRLWSILGVFYLLAVLPGLIQLLFPAAPRAVYYSMPIFRLPEFLMGACCYLIVSRNPSRIAIRGPWLPLMLLAMLTYLATLGPALPNFLPHNWIWLPFLACTIMLLSQQGTGTAKLLSSRPLVYLGRISYSFYSFQPLVMLLLISRHDAIAGMFPVLGAGYAFAALALLLLIATAALTHYLIENPARMRVKSWMAQGRQ